MRCRAPETIPIFIADAAHTTATTATPITPNPNLRALDKAPFYAVKMVLSDLGTCGGLQADDRARVLREDGSAINGLYVIGNTAANAFGATYPGAGATIAQGLVYGYIAAHDAAEKQYQSGSSASAFFSISYQNSGGGQGVFVPPSSDRGRPPPRRVFDHRQGELTFVGVIPLGPLQPDARICPRRIPRHLASFAALRCISSA